MVSSISLSRVQTLAGLARKAWIWAYSKGSKRDHRPSGLRKSGMPDSTEMPAPVKATMRQCWRRTAASFAGVVSFMAMTRDKFTTETHRSQRKKVQSSKFKVQGLLSQRVLSLTLNLE